MKSIIEQKVYYADTDAYGVVWHGTYLRWLEAGRIEFSDQLGYTLPYLESQDIVLPVVNINVRYKASARLNDKVIISTSISKLNSLTVTFEQKIFNESGKIFVEALVDVVAINKDGKLYRKLPPILTEMFNKAIEEKELDKLETCAP